MIDTIVINSPTLDENTALKIENVSIQRSGIDFEVGEMLYRFTTKELKGSWDNSIRLSVKREKLVSELDMRTLKKIAIKRECKPFVQVECSLHKFFIGHNIFGGSDNIKQQVLLLIAFLEHELAITLPNYLDWLVTRIDYARVYNLGSHIKDFFEGFSKVYYPRRRVHKYDNTGLYFPGTTTTLKLYDKGVEFKKHDKKVLQKILSPYEVTWLELLAQGILRIELEFHLRKLKNINNDKIPTVKELDIEILKDQYKEELKRVFKLGEDNMKIYNNSKEVSKKLHLDYGSEGNIYFGTWYKLSVFGYDYVKKDMAESTFYRHIKKLKQSSVSWNHTDISINENKVVHFVFNPFTSNCELNEDYIFPIAI